MSGNDYDPDQDPKEGMAPSDRLLEMADLFYKNGGTHDYRFLKDMARNVVVLPPQVWNMIDECHHSGLYGETRDKTILALLRPALMEAVSKGFATAPKK